MLERPKWDGRTVVCIASGPSLTKSDCEEVRASGHPVVVTNTTYRMCPWADALFAFDLKWWRHHGDEVREKFRGRTFTGSRVASNYGPEFAPGATWFRTFRNSGACAISLAMGAEASRIVLLGYDCGFDGVRKHWHEDHPGMSNCDSLPDWPRQFGQVAKHARRAGIEVINASRKTRLTCFDREDLSRAIAP